MLSDTQQEREASSESEAHTEQERGKQQGHTAGVRHAARKGSARKMRINVKMQGSLRERRAARSQCLCARSL